MNITVKLPQLGGCQCGACRYSVESLPYVAYTCHCSACQRLSSSAFNSCMQVASESVIVRQGLPVEQERLADSGNCLKTHFCGDCGSALFSRNSARPRIATVYLGTLDNPESIPVETHIWVQNKLSWIVLDERHRQFPASADWTTEYRTDLARYRPDVVTTDLAG